MDMKIFADYVEDSAMEQLNKIAKVFPQGHIRIMPDVHAGTGCVIGFTAPLVPDRVIPNLIGVDIGCGVFVLKLDIDNINLEALDDFIKNNIPAGTGMVYPKPEYPLNLYYQELHCYDNMTEEKITYYEQSLGTLGSGNHFIEIDIDEDNNYYLLIHSGSRALGAHVCKYYQSLTSDYNYQREIINKLKVEHREKEIEQTLKENQLPKDLRFLSYFDGQHYYDDIQLVQYYAYLNRCVMAKKICDYLQCSFDIVCDTVHNYIENLVIRKGAVSANEGEKLVIPMNMKDGALLCTGKGNFDWNFSAPHGAGRLMSRSQAKENLNLDEVRQELNASGVYSTTVPLDEAPAAYKGIESIIEKIQDTVTIDKIIKPIYNFKGV